MPDLVSYCIQFRIYSNIDKKFRTIRSITAEFCRMEFGGAALLNRDRGEGLGSPVSYSR